jgi:DNA-binding transcriptional ArsR family regulator
VPTAQAIPSIAMRATAMDAHATAAAALLKTLANAHRLRLLCQLLGRELAVGQLQEELPLSQSALSQHLAVLREAGLVRTRREAQQVFYAVNAGPALAILQVLHDHYCAPGAKARGRRSSR